MVFSFGFMAGGGDGGGWRSVGGSPLCEKIAIILVLKKSYTLVIQMKHEDGHFFLLQFQTHAGLLSSVRLSPPGLVLRVQLHHLSIAPASVIRSQQGRRTL